MILRILKLRFRYFRRALVAFFGFCPECGAGLVFDQVLDKNYDGSLMPRGWCPWCKTVKP
jgi:hypothetical protein